MIGFKSYFRHLIFATMKSIRLSIIALLSLSLVACGQERKIDIPTSNSQNQTEPTSQEPREIEERVVDYGGGENAPVVSDIPEKPANVAHEDSIRIAMGHGLGAPETSQHSLNNGNKWEVPTEIYQKVEYMNEQIDIFQATPSKDAHSYELLLETLMQSIGDINPQIEMIEERATIDELTKYLQHIDLLVEETARSTGARKDEWVQGINKQLKAFDTYFTTTDE